jgi:AcrR family transcriptional regulator
VVTAVPLQSERPSGPRSQKGARTRARLVEAAKEVFEEHGFLDARISDIAERASLSHGSFYHYFDSKEEVFREVATDVDERLSAPLDAVILDPGSDAPPRERIREAIRRYLETYRDEARIIGVIEQVTRYDEDLAVVREERHERYRHQVADSIRQLQRHGLADPTLDPLVAAAAVGAVTNRFPEMWFVQGVVECSFDEGVDHLARIFANALLLPDVPSAAPTGERPQRR